MSVKTKLLMTSDRALGFVGGGMALASASFGIYMNVHGPAPGSLGNSHDFTVFAQLAPHGASAPKASPDRHPDPDEDLDMTSTASIPGRSRADADPARSSPAVTLESAEGDAATIAVAGQRRIVHVGDTIPGAGEVLAIMPGRRPALKTSQGLIVSSR
jgi:hypothetical protein